MNLLDLKYFVDIARCGSVSAAARANIIAQQSMSDHLKKLERHYGALLFSRTNPLTITPEGELLLAAAQTVLHTLEHAEQEIRALRSARETVLGLGLVFNDTPPFLGELLSRFHRETEFAFSVRVHSDCLRHGTLPDDIELILSPFPPAADWECITLFWDRAAAVVHTDLMDRIYGARRAAVEEAMLREGDLTLLSELPFFQFTPDGPPPAVSSDPEKVKLPRIILRSGSGDLQKSVCLDGQCAITLMEKYARDAFHGRDDILIFPLSGVGDRVNFRIYWPSGRPLSPAAEAFLRVAERDLKDF